jgi:hypothetical protein
MISPWGMRGKGIEFADRPVVPAVPCPREPMDGGPYAAGIGGHGAGAIDAIRRDAFDYGIVGYSAVTPLP